MQDSDIPALKFPIPWGNSAGGGFIRAIPVASQIGITAGAASLTDGFPPVNFTPPGAGGTPPFGQDANGILNEITLWTRWYTAGAPIGYDATFSTAIGGYPKGAIIVSATFPKTWLSTVDNNASDPDTGGANWLDPNKVTYQKFTTGSGTATPTAGATRWHVRMCGGGGSGGNTSGAGAAGGQTSLDTWTAHGGSGGAQSSSGGGGGPGGTGGTNGTGTLIARINGGYGAGGNVAPSSSISFTAVGGVNPFGGNGSVVSPNTGAGGRADGTVSGGVSAPTGGGAGEYVEFDILNPAGVSYVVGAGGTGGTAVGAAGIILIEEHFN